jgi:thiol-disulfide isomerase/thioredoxin
MSEPTAPPSSENTDSATPDTMPSDGKPQDIIGVMAAHSSWIVPEWIKGVALVVSAVAIGGLVWTQIDKRAMFRNLLVDSTVEPESMGERVAPSFALPKGGGTDDKAIDLASFKGSWVLINFWATWCPPCRDEMPSLEMLTRRLGRDHAQAIKVVTISVDEDWNEVNRFFGATQPTFPVLWDREKVAARAYSTTKFPETYLIDPNGKLAAKFTGPRDWYNQGMVQYFDEVLKGQRKPVT